MSPDQIRAFQDRPSYDWLGMRLKPDGILGPKTRWALAVAELDPRRQAIVENACGFVGLTERETNRHPDIDAWLQRCGAPLGSPWCAAFASWCISVNGLKNVRVASAQKLGQLHTRATTRPVPGDVMWFPTGEWTGHCGIVVGVGLDAVATVEGNQDNAVRLVRRLRSQVRFGDVLNRSEVFGEVPVPPGLPLVPVRAEGTR